MDRWVMRETEFITPTNDYQKNPADS